MPKNKITAFFCLFVTLLFVTSCFESETKRPRTSDTSETVVNNDSETDDSAKTTEIKEDTKSENKSEEKTEKSSNDGKVYTPQKGSAERDAIFNALRVPVEKELKQEIVFAPNNFKVFGDWAFIGGEPLTKSGKKPDLKGTKYEDEADMFDSNFFALLKKDGSKWKVVTYALGCTDVCYLGWDKEFNAPKQIFP